MTNQNIDTLSTCPKCSGDACYVVPINKSRNSYFCFSCGYTTSDLQKVGEFDIKLYEESVPELYKDCKYIDSEERVWYPGTINIPHKGTVFLNGPSAQKAQWCAIKARPLTEEEKKSLANKGMTHKSDSKTLKNFENDFIEALDYIGFFDKEIVD